jgi:hypothetical protein
VNQLRGILLGLVLLSGTLTPSFAQTTDYSDGPYFSFFKLLKYLFSSEDVIIITNSGRVLDFDDAIIHTSSITGTNPTEDETKNKRKDKTEYKTRDDIDDFHHGIIHVSSKTSAKTTVEKVTLCHVPSGNPSKAHTITIANQSVAAHLSHGDYLGTCDDSKYTDKHPILHFGKAKVITSSNTGVIQLYNKILYLQSNPSISIESLKTQVLSVLSLYTFLENADKQDIKEFQQLFSDYKKIVKQLLKKADEQSKHTIENILEQAKDRFEIQYKDHKFNDESKHKEFNDESKHKEFKDESKHKEFKDESKHKEFKDESKHKEFKDESKHNYKKKQDKESKDKDD